MVASFVRGIARELRGERVRSWTVACVAVSGAGVWAAYRVFVSYLNAA
jgi:hypothetical protein